SKDWRITLRLTSSRAESSRSVGSASPGASRSSPTSSRMLSTTLSRNRRTTGELGSASGESERFIGTPEYPRRRHEHGTTRDRQKCGSPNILRGELAVQGIGNRVKITAIDAI